MVLLFAAWHDDVVMESAPMSVASAEGWAHAGGWNYRSAGCDTLLDHDA